MDDAIIRNNGDADGCKEDLISRMPDEIIHHILSFLDIEKAIQTSLLSKRWEFTWTTMPTLSFDCSERDFNIDRTLMYYRGSRIKKFNLKVQSPDEFNSRISSWIRFALSRQVEDFSFYNYDIEYEYVMSRYLYNHSYFVNLTLMGCFLPPAPCVSWNLLKRLYLSEANMSVKADSMPLDSILAGSPQLEYLGLENCLVGKRIASTSLITLKITELYGNSNANGYGCEVEIYAPHLLYLTLSQHIFYIKWKPIYAPSLLEASLTFEMDKLIFLDRNGISEYHDYIKELIEQLSHVPKISLEMRCLQILAIRELKGLSLPPLKWQTLTLDIMQMNCCIPGILHLLKSSPHLRKLTINMTEYNKKLQELEDDYIFGQFNLEKGESWISRMTTTNCPLVHLNLIQINGAHMCLRSKVGKTIVDFLLQTSSDQAKILLSKESD